MKFDPNKLKGVFTLKIDMTSDIQEDKNGKILIKICSLFHK